MKSNNAERTLRSRGILRFMLMAILAWTSAFAQQTPGAEQPARDKTIETLTRKIADLEATQKQMQEKIDKLGGGPVSSAQPQTPAPVHETAADQSDPADTPSPDPSESMHTLGPVQFQGFTDFNYGRPWFEKLPETGLAGSPRSFNIGDFDLFTNTRISDRWSVLAELLVTSDFSNEFAAEMDRFMFTYKQNDYFKVSFGKFSTALGYYTNAFHRAQYFQTTAGRPIMYSDEDNGGILPVHSIGISATGKIPTGSLGLHWVVELANGRNVRSDVPIQNFVDYKNGKAVNFALYARPDWLHGFQAGVSVYRDTLYPIDMDPIKQTIVTAHAAYVGRRLEWLNEASMLRHALPGGRVIHDTTSYTEIAWAFGKLRPYFRYDYQNIPAGDPIFGPLGRRSGPSFGINRHISNYVVLKLQYGRLGEREAASVNALTGQLAFAF